MAVGAPASARAQALYPDTAWRWGNPTPHGFEFATVQSAGSRFYAQDISGRLLRSDDRGRTWRDLGEPGGEESRLAVLGPDSLIVTSCRSVYVSEDGGRSLRRASVLPPTACVTAAGRQGPREALLATGDGATYTVSLDGELRPRGSMSGPGKSISFVSAAEGFATIGSQPTALLRTRDGGRSWQRVLVAGGLGGVQALDADNVLVASASQFLRSADGGTTFVASALAGLPPGSSLMRFDCRSSTRCAFVAADSRSGQLYTTADGGNSLSRIAGSRTASDVAYGDRGTALAVGEHGLVLASADDGVSYTRIGAGNALYFGDDFSSSGRTIHTPTYDPGGMLARSRDGGRSWSTFTVPVAASEDLFDPAFSNARNGWVGTYGPNGRLRVLRTRDGGARWREVLRASAKIADSMIVAAGRPLLAGQTGVRALTGGRLRRLSRARGLRSFDRRGKLVVAYGARRAVFSANSGRSWRRLRLPRGRRLDDLEIVSRRRLFAVARSGALFRTTDGGRRWSQVLATGGRPASDVEFGSSRSGYLDVSFPQRYLDPGGYDGTAALLHTADGGRTWRPQFRLAENRIGALHPIGARSAVMSIGQDLVWTRAAGNPRGGSRLVLRAGRARVRRGATVRLSGRLSSAAAGRPVRLWARSRGRWASRALRTGAGGRFTTTWRIGSATAFVAQATGDSVRPGAGSPLVRVRVR